MTLRISLVAVCCSCASDWSFRASASCPSRSRTLALSSLGDLRATGGLASLDFVGFGPRRIGLPLPPYESAGARLGERGRVSKWRLLAHRTEMRLVPTVRGALDLAQLLPVWRTFQIPPRRVRST